MFMRKNSGTPCSSHILRVWVRGAKIAAIGLAKDVSLGLVTEVCLKTYGWAGLSMIPQTLVEWAGRNRWDLARWPKSRKPEQTITCPSCFGQRVAQCITCEGTGTIKGLVCTTCLGQKALVCGTCRGRGTVTARDLR